MLITVWTTHPAVVSLVTYISILSVPLGCYFFKHLGCILIQTASIGTKRLGKSLLFFHLIFCGERKRAERVEEYNHNALNGTPIRR